MRRIYIITALGLFMTAATAQPVSLQLFGGKDFEPGLYSVSAIDAASKARGNGEPNRCVISPESLLHTGLEAADGQNCVNTVVEDTAERATVAYSCRGIGSGRTTIIKDNRNHFTVDAQGIAGRTPFAMRQELKRIGNCNT